MAKQFNANKFLDELVTAGNLPKEVAESIKTAVVGNEKAVKYLQTSFETKQYSDSRIAEEQNKAQAAIQESNRLKGEYETKLAAVQGLEGQIRQKEQQLQGEYGQKAQQTQAQLQQMQQAYAKAVGDVQRVIDTANKFTGGSEFLTAAGLPVNPQGYQVMPQFQPAPQGFDPATQFQQPMYQQPYGQQPQYGQQGYQYNQQPQQQYQPPVPVQQQPKPAPTPSIDDLYNRIAPDMMQVAALNFEIPMLMNEYQQLTGKQLDTLDFKNHVANGAGKSVREVFEETYNIPYLRQQKAQAEQQKLIEAKAEELYQARIGAEGYPSAKPMNVENEFVNKMRTPTQQPDPNKAPEPMSPTGLARSTVQDALADWNQSHQATA